MSRTALLAGSSGLVGGHCLRLLLDDDAYRSVKILVRRELPLRHPKLEQHIVDYEHLAGRDELFRVDDVFCCLGTTIARAGSQEAFARVDRDYPIAIAQRAVANEAKQFLLVSSLGADPASRIFYSRMKGQVEEGVRALALESVLIFRPSMLLGRRSERRLQDTLARPAVRAISFFLVGRLRKYRAIQAEAVARAMVFIAKQHRIGVHIYESDRIEEIAHRSTLPAS